MKQKKNIYILAPLVLIIWGLIGYRVFKTLNPSDTTPELENSYVFQPEKIKETEKFSINANYRDPFLGKVQHTKKRTVKKAKTKQVIESTVTTPFPQITYKGMVAPKALGKPAVFLVTINNAQHFLSVGKQIEEVQLVNGNAKEITVRFQNTQKTISLQ